MDTGAERGGESCWFADLAPDRTVRAIEPLPWNVNSIQQLARTRTNIKVVQGGLGSKDRFVKFKGEGAAKHTKSGSMLISVHTAPSAVLDNTTNAQYSFRVRRLDDLYEHDWRGARLAFGHFDVEGAELDLLEGADVVIQRHRPVFTVEFSDGRRGTTSRNALFKHIVRYKYRCYAIPEQCGLKADCRNAVCFPAERDAPEALLTNASVALVTS